MLHPILFNSCSYIPSVSDLSCLVTYADKTGGSQFSMTMLAHLCIGGEKALVLTAYPMAKENFLGQIEGKDLSIGTITTIEDIQNNRDKDVIFIESGNAELFKTTLDSLPDSGDRIIFLKNFEIFPDDVLEKILMYKKIFLSGNIDKSTMKDKIREIPYSSIVAFSKPQCSLPISYEEQETYCGYAKMVDNTGIIKLEIL